MWSVGNKMLASGSICKCAMLKFRIRIKQRSKSDTEIELKSMPKPKTLICDYIFVNYFKKELPHLHIDTVLKSATFAYTNAIRN